MTDPRTLSAEIKHRPGLVSMTDPDLATRVTPDELRRMAAECIHEARAEAVLEPFRRAFEGTER